MYYTLFSIRLAGLSMTARFTAAGRFFRSDVVGFERDKGDLLIGVIGGNSKHTLFLMVGKS